jgi:hypothetical protein
MPSAGFENENPSKQMAADPRFNPAAAGKDSVKLLFCGELADQLGNYQHLSKVLWDGVACHL